MAWGAVEVVDHQGGRLDPDADPLAAEDLRRQQHVTAEGDQAVFGDDPFDFDRVTFGDRRQRGGAGVDRALGGEVGEVGDGQVGADGLDPGPGDEQVDQVAVGPEPHGLPGPDRTGPSQNCFPDSHMFPDGGTTRSSSTGPPVHSDAAGSRKS